MTAVRLSTALVSSGHQYTLQLSGGVTVNQIARYLSQYETHLAVNTLEIVRPLQPDRRLQDIDIQAGDRLLVALQPPGSAELPAPLRPGDKTLKFARGDYEIKLRGKRGVLVGKPDETGENIPDVDLRYFVLPEALEHISRGCLWLNFDESSKTWFASRMGQTRIMIDEYELGAIKISLNDAQWVRFYRESDDPRQITSQPVGELRLILEEVRSTEDLVHIETGTSRINVRVGTERSVQTLNASGNLRAGQIMTSLASYSGVTLSPDARIYLARLLPPDSSVADLSLGKDEFLYTALNPSYARNAVTLRDIHEPARAFVLSAGVEDEEKLIGCRMQEEVPDPSLAVDLYEAVTAKGYDPGLFNAISRYQARLLYRSAEKTWWIGLTERSRVPLFINNTRVTGDALVQLTSGDVLSFGPSVEHYYIRLDAEITARSD